LNTSRQVIRHESPYGTDAHHKKRHAECHTSWQASVDTQRVRRCPLTRYRFSVRCRSFWRVHGCLRDIAGRLQRLRTWLWTPPGLKWGACRS